MARKTTKAEKATEKTPAANPVEVAAKPDLVPNQPASDETRPNRSPSHEEISRRAYELWVKRGGVGGNAQEDWLHAEQELRAPR
jgi:hypothetical protein